jgi:hypothetical protein
MFFKGYICVKSRYPKIQIRIRNSGSRIRRSGFERSIYRSTTPVSLLAWYVSVSEFPTCLVEPVVKHLLQLSKVPNFAVRCSATTASAVTVLYSLHVI